MTFTPPVTNGRAGLDSAHGGPLPAATLPELIGRLINDVSDLADRQIELAKQEIGEAKDEAISAVKRLAIGGGIGVVAGLLFVIWAWTAFIWFFNWLGAFIVFPTPFGPQSLAWKRFIQRGIHQAMSIWPPLPRTRETLKEDLEWVKHLRTRSDR